MGKRPNFENIRETSRNFVLFDETIALFCVFSSFFELPKIVAWTVKMGRVGCLGYWVPECLGDGEGRRRTSAERGMKSQTAIRR